MNLVYIVSSNRQLHYTILKFLFTSNRVLCKHFYTFNPCANKGKSRGVGNFFRSLHFFKWSSLLWLFENIWLVLYSYSDVTVTIATITSTTFSSQHFWIENIFELPHEFKRTLILNKHLTGEWLACDRQTIWCNLQPYLCLFYCIMSFLWHKK